MRHCPVSTETPAALCLPPPGEVKSLEIQSTFGGPARCPMSGWIKCLRGVRVETEALKRNKDLVSTRTLHSLVLDEGVEGSNPIADLAARRKRALCSWTGAAQLVQKSRISGRRSRRELFCGSSFCGAAPRTCICFFGMFPQRFVLMPLPCAVSTFPTARAASWALP